MWHGESTCVSFLKSGVPCTHKAYYNLNGQPKCGRHASKNSGRRRLPKNPLTVATEQRAVAEHKASIEAVRAQNAAQGQPGKVGLYRLRGAFAVKVPAVPGYQSVLPNHANTSGKARADGAIGMSSLSPKVRSAMLFLACWGDAVFGLLA